MVTVYSPSPEIDLESIRRTAGKLQLRVDDVTERRGPLTTKLTVVVTGAGKQIETFRELFEGDCFRGGGLVDEFILNPMLSAAHKYIARRWRKRPSPRSDSAPSEAAQTASDGDPTPLREL